MAENKRYQFKTAGFEGRTPVGRMAFPKLLEADDKFGSPKYSVGMLYPTDSKEYKDLIGKIEALHAAAVAEVNANVPKPRDKAGKPIDHKVVEAPGRVYLDRDKEPTTDSVVTFKADGQRTAKDGTVQDVPLSIYDKFGKPWDRSVDIGGGSLGCVYYSCRPFYTAGLGVGVSLQMKAAQIKEARSWTPKIDVIADDGDVPEASVDAAPLSDGEPGTVGGGSF